MPMQTADIPLSEIRVMLGRRRREAGLEEMTESMGELGQWVPAKVIQLPQPEGPIKYEIYSGEGRYKAAKKLKQETLMCIIEKPTAEELVGEYLGSNMLRRTQTWAESGRTIRDLMKRGKSIEDVAKRLHITPAYAKKCLQVLDRAAADVADEIGKLSMEDALALTSLPRGQNIILKVSKYVQQPVREVVAEAKRLMPEGHDWSAKDLSEGLAKIKPKVEDIQEDVKVLILHDQLGPQLADALLANKKCLAAVKKAGVNLSLILNQ